MKEMEIYVHIPFCVKKCLYCDFLSAPAEESVQISYVRRLLEEMDALSTDYADREVTSVYIGGGTPTILDPVYSELIIDGLFKDFHIKEDAEISMECNPGTLSGGKARILRRAGVNRLSIGLQSIHDGELKMLGRIHGFEDFLMSFEEARKAGFRNINTDLIFALPGQSTADWHETLKKTVLLRPEHISAYSLIIEEGTPFFARYHADDLLRERGGEPALLPTEDEERAMYYDTASYLKEHGYRQYEISNFAREGRACRHNIGYWTGEDYLGLGLGAASLIGNVRFRNTRSLNEYMSKPFARSEVKPLDRKAQIEEFMFLGLRMTDGISRSDFAGRFGIEPEGVYGGTLAGLEEEGLLEAGEGRIRLTSVGVDVSNVVFARLLL